MAAGAAAIAALGCKGGDEEPVVPPGFDASFDVSVDIAPQDGQIDVGAEAGPDAEDAGDASPEAATDATDDGAPDVSLDVASEAAIDAPVDVASDAPEDVSVDAADEATADADLDADAADADLDANADLDAADADLDADAGLDGADADADAPADAQADADADAPADAITDAITDAIVEADAATGPVLVAQGFGKVLAVVAGATDVYFTTYGSADGGTYAKDGTVVRCPIAGGCAASTTVLASGLNNPAYLAIDASRLYVGAAGAVGSGQYDGFVYSCPLAGCGAGDVDRVTLSPGLQNLGGIAASAGWVYWVHNPLTNTCGRAPADGGAVQWLGNANGYSSVGVTVDDANAYWTHTYYPPAIHVASFDGGGGRVLVDVAAADGGLAPQGLTYDDGYLYYVSVLGNEVNRVLVDGGGLETLAAGMHGPSWLALDATDVYVGDYYSPNTIRRVPKSGGGATVFATPNAQLTSLAANGAAVFWSTATGQVWMQAK